MIQLLLAPVLLCLGLDAPKQHAALHPANVDVYIEASDVASLVKAYAQAPVVQLMSDPATGKIADLAKELGFDVRATLQDLLPIADATRPDDRFWPWSAASAISISVSELNPNTASAEVKSKIGRGWIVVDFKDSSAAEQAVKAAVAMSGVERDTAEVAPTLSIDTRQVTVTRLANAALGRAWLAQDGTRLIGGFGGVDPSEIANRIAKPESSFIEKHKQLVDEASFKSNCGVTIVRAWSELVELPLAWMPEMSATDAVLVNTFAPAFLPFVGQKGRYRLQLCGDRFVSESFVERIGAAKQLDDLYLHGAGDIPPATARMVPKDAVGVWLMKIQPAQFEALMERTLTGMNGAAALKPDDKAPKISAAVGDSAVMFMPPISPASLTQGEVASIAAQVLAVPLIDGAAFKIALEAWIERAKVADPKLKVENKPYHKRPMYTFTFGGSSDDAGAESAVKPTITILADRVLVTTNRKNAYSEVRRLEAPSTEAHPLAAEGALQKGAFEVSTMDWAATLGKLYETGRGLLPMFSQGREQPIDVEALPTALQLFRFFRPSLSFSQRIEGKTYTYSESSFGPEVPVLALTLAVIGRSRMFETSTSSERESSSTTTGSSAPQKPAPADSVKPVADPQRDTTVKALRSVRTGLAIYKSQFQRAPAALDDLLKGTADFPKGFLESNELPKDGWGRGLVYAALDNGAKYDLRSLGANGVDDKGAGDDVLLP